MKVTKQRARDTIVRFLESQMPQAVVNRDPRTFETEPAEEWQTELAKVLPNFSASVSCRKTREAGTERVDVSLVRLRPRER